MVKFNSHHSKETLSTDTVKILMEGIWMCTTFSQVCSQACDRVGLAHPVCRSVCLKFCTHFLQTSFSASGSQKSSVHLPKSCGFILVVNLWSAISTNLLPYPWPKFFTEVHPTQCIVSVPTQLFALSYAPVLSQYKIVDNLCVQVRIFCKLY